MRMPPLAQVTLAVTHREEGSQRKATMGAMSSTVPMRSPAGVRAITPCSMSARLGTSVPFHLCFSQFSAIFYPIAWVTARDSHIRRYWARIDGVSCASECSPCITIRFRPVLVLKANEESYQDPRPCSSSHFPKPPWMLHTRWRTECLGFQSVFPNEGVHDEPPTTPCPGRTDVDHTSSLAEIWPARFHDEHWKQDVGMHDSVEHGCVHIF